MVVSALLVCGVAAVFSLALTPLLRALATGIGLLDAPGHRKIHCRPTPRIGGVAVFLATTAALAAAVPILDVGVATLPLLIGASMVFAVGLRDDIRETSALPKVCVQVLAAFVLVANDIRITHVALPGGIQELGLFSFPITIIWIVLVTNAFNLIDGLDGLAAGLAIIAGITCAVDVAREGDVASSMMLAAVVGALSGFLVYNFNPASIFLGDGGSLFVGFMLASVAVVSWQRGGGTADPAGVSVLAFCVPMLDTVQCITRRLWCGGLRQVIRPDLAHIHHRLVAGGWSHRRAVLLLYVVSASVAVVSVLRHLR